MANDTKSTSNAKAAKVEVNDLGQPVSDGSTVHLPVTPEEIAQEGTDISADYTDDPTVSGEENLNRLWALDNNPTTRFRGDLDPFKPDAVESV